MRYYKNNGKYAAMIPNVGHFVPGEIFSSPIEINNVLYTEVSENDYNSYIQGNKQKDAAPSAPQQPAEPAKPAENK